MVEKVLNARRAAPKQQEDQLSVRSISSTMQAKRPIKPVLSPDSTGFGRTLSKKSLDMALRHMVKCNACVFLTSWCWSLFEDLCLGFWLCMSNFRFYHYLQKLTAH
jgi:hypothetical protein